MKSVTIERSSDIYNGEQVEISEATLPGHVRLAITETDDRVANIVVLQSDLEHAVEELAKPAANDT